MLPTVDFCGLTVTRLIIGANPFGGFSHQSPERDQAMREYYDTERILETWSRAESAGINTMITNNESDNVVKALLQYFHNGGTLQWIAQVNSKQKSNMFRAIDRVVEIGCSALYFHGGLVDQLFLEKDVETLRSWCEYASALGVPAGVAGHAPEVHRWASSLDVADFHAVCFFNCGSLHAGKGHKFQIRDLAPATACIRKLRKPCIAYKIMGAGRIEPRMAFEHAFEHIKPADVVNVGMYRGDKDGMIEENAKLVKDILL